MIVLVFLYYMFAAEASLACDVYYDGQYDGLVANCSYRNLYSVPIDLPPHFVVLNFTGNKLTSLKAKDFFKYQNIRVLVLSDNQISTFDSECFNGLTNLKSLHLERNLFNYDSLADVFKSLTALQYLNVHCPLKYVGEFPDHIFQSLIKLKTLVMDAWPDVQHRHGMERMHSLQKLSIIGASKCRLAKIDNSTFSILGQTSIESLSIHCYISEIDSGALVPLSGLKQLTFRGTFSSIISIRRVTTLLKPFVGRNMTEIDFTSLQSIREATIIDRVLSKKTMTYLLDICVETLRLGNNRLRTISLDVIDSKLGKCVKYLNLEHNHITGQVPVIFSLGSLENLISIDLSNSIPVDTELGDLSPVSKKLHVTVTCPSNLHEILFHSGLNFPVIEKNITFINCTKLYKLDLSSTGRCEAQNYIVGLSNLKYLDISNNNIYESFFSNFDFVSGLETLISQSVTMNFDFMSSSSFLSMTNLCKLDLSTMGLRIVKPYSLRNFYNVKKLILRRNLFDIIPDELMYMSSLTHLDMSQNALRLLSPETRSKLDNLNEIRDSFSLNLEGNIFSCSCSTLDFIVWLVETAVQLDGDRNYSCIKDDGKMTDTKTFYNNYLQQWRKCIGHTLLTATLCLLFALVISLTTAFLIQKYFPKIDHFVLKALGYDVKVSLKRRDFQYDAYICYDSTDYQWPCHCLLKELQNLDRNIRLYLPDLHELPGESKAESIIEAISNSWKVVIVISEKSFTDEWFYFTIVSAVRLFSSRNAVSSRIILIYKDDAPEIRARVPSFLVNTLVEENVFNARDEDNSWIHLYRVMMEESSHDAVW